MSKSLRRVIAALDGAGLTAEVVEMPSETRTAAQAADAAGCEIDQIAKSIIFQGQGSERLYLFITAGGRQVAPDRAANLAGEALMRAEADTIRAVTGFAIGCVAPLGHKTPIACFFDANLAGFDQIWAAAGTPRHIFPVSPVDLMKILGVQPSEFTQVLRFM